MTLERKINILKEVVLGSLLLYLVYRNTSLFTIQLVYLFEIASLFVIWVVAVVSTLGFRLRQLGKAFYLLYAGPSYFFATLLVLNVTFGADNFLDELTSLSTAERTAMAITAGAVIALNIVTTVVLYRSLPETYWYPMAAKALYRYTFLHMSLPLIAFIFFIIIVLLPLTLLFSVIESLGIATPELTTYTAAPLFILLYGLIRANVSLIRVFEKSMQNRKNEWGKRSVPPSNESNFFDL